jgi:hypothetical protein
VGTTEEWGKLWKTCQDQEVENNFRMCRGVIYSERPVNTVLNVMHMYVYLAIKLKKNGRIFTFNSDSTGEWPLLEA